MSLHWLAFGLITRSSSADGVKVSHFSEKSIFTIPWQLDNSICPCDVIKSTERFSVIKRHDWNLRLSSFSHRVFIWIWRDVVNKRSSCFGAVQLCHKFIVCDLLCDLDTSHPLILPGTVRSHSGCDTVAGARCCRSSQWFHQVHGSTFKRSCSRGYLTLLC